MFSLSKLLAVFKGPFAKQPDRTEPVNLCRFIFQSNHYSTAQSKPKPNAFLPAPNKTRISMFFVDSLSDQEIWSLGDFVGKGRNTNVKARAELPAKTIWSVELCKLEIEPDPAPHPRHVDISGWPPDKDTQKAIALDLCAASTLYVR